MQGSVGKMRTKLFNLEINEEIILANRHVQLSSVRMIWRSLLNLNEQSGLLTFISLTEESILRPHCPSLKNDNYTLMRQDRENFENANCLVPQKGRRSRSRSRKSLSLIGISTPTLLQLAWGRSYIETEWVTMQETLSNRITHLQILHIETNNEE